MIDTDELLDPFEDFDGFHTNVSGDALGDVGVEVMTSGGQSYFFDQVRYVEDWSTDFVLGYYAVEISEDVDVDGEDDPVRRLFFPATYFRADEVAAIDVRPLFSARDEITLLGLGADDSGE